MGQAAFAALMADGGADVPLDEAALAISGALQPGLDLIEWLAALDLLAGDCPTPTAEGVSRYLFGSLGFRGDTERYGDWRNSALDHVISRRLGIPITLSVLMIEVGRRIGVSLVPVAMPAHVIVGVTGDGAGEVFFDPFGGGQQLDREGARDLFATVTGARAAWREEYLAPTPPRQIVIRMLNNLKATAASRRDSVRLGIVMQLRSAIPELAPLEEKEILAATAVFN